MESPDAKMPVEPRVIAGGGIGDGPVDGVLNLYVIDDVSRQPIANATVRVGTLDGTTDSTGLFVAQGVTGPQTIAVKAPGHRSEVWVGANGANVTVDLVQANDATPASGTLMGSITNFASLTVAAGHAKLVMATYSQTDDLGDPANEIAQPANQNICVGTTTCNFTVTSRTGKVAVVAAIFDRDLKGTPTDPSDDTQVFLGWAVKTGLTVSSGASQSVALDIVSQTQDVTVSFGTPPSGLSQVGALVNIDSPDGTIPLASMVATPAAPTVKVPRLDAIASGATYRLIGVASDGAANGAQSIVLRRGLTSTSLAAGDWLAPPTGSPTRSGGSWTAPSAATAVGIEYKQGATKALNISVLDGSTSVTIPDLITLPSGSLTVGLQAIGAPGLDVTNFSLDADKTKLVMVGGSTTELGPVP